MALPNNTATISYSGNGSTSTPYPIPFKFFSNDHIKIYADGVLVTSGYTVTGAGLDQGGQVVTNTTYSVSTKITILRVVPLDQPYQYREGDPLPAKNLEDQQDYQGMQIQQLHEQQTRSALYPVGENLDSLANTTLGHNSKGALVARSKQDEIDHLGIGGQVDQIEAAAANAQNTLNEISTLIPSETFDFSNLVNIKHYGAIGDGVADDTASITSAINKARTLKTGVYIPSGNYKVTGTAFNLNWEGATVIGDSAGIGGSIITTTSTTLPVVESPADYNHLQLHKFKIVGPGRDVSTGYGIKLDGSLNIFGGGGSNIDLLHFSNVTVSGFKKGIDAKGVANASFDRVAVENCTTSAYLYGNSNSVTFENCAFVCVDGSIAGTKGLEIAPSCNGVLVSTCDAGGPTLEWCIWDEGINTSVHAGQWECYGSGMHSINGLTWVGTAVREFGTASANRWSLQASTGTIVGVNLGVRSSVTGAAIRSNSTISRNLFVYGNVAEKIDFYTAAAPGGTLYSTAPTAHIPVTVQATGLGASASSHGSSFKRISQNINDQWFHVVKDKDNNFKIIDLYRLSFESARQNENHANNAAAYAAGYQQHQLYHTNGVVKRVY